MRMELPEVCPSKGVPPDPSQMLLYSIDARVFRDWLGSRGVEIQIESPGVCPSKGVPPDPSQMLLFY